MSSNETVMLDVTALGDDEPKYIEIPAASATIERYGNNLIWPLDGSGSVNIAEAHKIMRQLHTAAERSARNDAAVLNKKRPVRGPRATMLAKQEG